MTKTKLKTYYQEAGYQVGEKDYIDNLAIQEALKPVIKLLIAKKLEAEQQGNSEAEYAYRTLYLEIMIDAGISLTVLAELFSSFDSK